VAGGVARCGVCFMCVQMESADIETKLQAVHRDMHLHTPTADSQPKFGAQCTVINTCAKR